MPKMLDLMRKTQRGEIGPPPVARLIGFTLTSVEPGEAVIEFMPTARHANPMGTLHGGILCDVADAAMGVAWAAPRGGGDVHDACELDGDDPAWRRDRRAVRASGSGGHGRGKIVLRVAGE